MKKKQFLLSSSQFIAIASYSPISSIIQPSFLALPILFLASSNHYSTIIYLEINVFSFHMWQRTCSVSLSVSGLVNIMSVGSTNFTANDIIPFFICLYNIPLYRYVAHIHYPFTHGWSFRLASYLDYCE
jgi:hypothetical protein